MLNVSDNVKTLLQKGYKQLIRIRFPNDNKTIELTNDDIVKKSFQWDRYCATGDMLEIGSAVSAEISFTLRNKGSFLDTGGGSVPIEDISFEGKELTVDIGISKWDAHRWENATVTWFTIGKFTIMSMPHKLFTIKISALDRMTWFDLYVPMEEEQNPFSSTETLHSIVSKICAVLHINYSFPSTLPNYDLVVDMDALFEEAPDLTYRMLIQWAAALTGTCAYINPAGDLIFRWLERAQNVTLTPWHRFSSIVYEPVQFTGLTAEKNDQILEFGGNTHYRFKIEDNSLIQGDNWTNTYQEAIGSIWTKLYSETISYRPFEASTVPLPYLEPMDIISYKEKDGTVFDTIISHITFTLNGSTNISAVGISETEAQCVTPGGKTSRESADIKALKNKIAYLENATAAARSRLTDLMRIALGLHMIEVTADDGGTVYYFTTADIQSETPTLADLGEAVKPNDVIYTLSGAGWVWCYGSDWDKIAQAPAKDWRYGITKDGSAVLGLINTTGITVSDEDTAYSTHITPERFSVYKDSTFVFGFNGQLESQINRLLVKSNIDNPNVDNDAYIRLGSAMLVPAAGGMDIVYVEDI